MWHQSANSGRGIPPLLLFLRFLPFSSLKGFGWSLNKIDDSSWNLQKCLSKYRVIFLLYLTTAAMGKVVMLQLSGVNGQAGSCVPHSEWFSSVLSSSCTHCTHNTSLSFIFKSAPPSLPLLPHDNKTASRAVWSDRSHLGRQQRPNLPPLSPSLSPHTPSSSHQAESRERKRRALARKAAVLARSHAVFNTCVN